MKRLHTIETIRDEFLESIVGGDMPADVQAFVVANLTSHLGEGGTNPGLINAIARIGGGGA